MKRDWSEILLWSVLGILGTGFALLAYNEFKEKKTSLPKPPDCVCECTLFGGEGR